MKKIIAMLLVCLLALTAVACNKEVAPPEGMIDASTADAEYYLYVPETWVLNNGNGISGAYASASQRSNVTLTSYLPDEQLSAERYFNEICLPQYQNGTLANFALTENGTDATMGGLNAKKYVYTYTLGDASYKTMQVVLSTGKMVYNLTFTALDSAYDLAIEDVNSIVANFRFR